MEKFRILRSRLLRLFISRPTHLTGCMLKFGVAFLILLFLVSYIQEKHSKEALIDMALGSASVNELVRPDNDTLILRPDRLKVRNPFVVIVVTSLPENVERRTIIRQTWGNKAAEYGIGVVFFLGKPGSGNAMVRLQKEHEEHNDLVVDDFTESYYALAVKTLRVFKYFKFHHRKSKFLVKTDDDVFVNVPNLVHYCVSVNKGLEGHHPNSEVTALNVPSYFLGGVIHSDRGPHTWNVFSKWYAPQNVWRLVFHSVINALVAKSESEVSKVSQSKNDNNAEAVSVFLESLDEAWYPPYAEGNFYVLSDDTVRDILRVSQQVPLYHLEDVYVTGVLATWMLKIEKNNTPAVSSASNIFPKLSYWWFKMFVPPEEIIAFHCDNHVELISSIYQESVQ